MNHILTFPSPLEGYEEKEDPGLKFIFCFFEGEIGEREEKT